MKDLSGRRREFERDAALRKVAGPLVLLAVEDADVESGGSGVSGRALDEVLVDARAADARADDGERKGGRDEGVRLSVHGRLLSQGKVGLPGALFSGDSQGSHTVSSRQTWPQ